MYKYKFHEKLRKLSDEDYQISWQFFPQALGMSRDTWKRWIYTKIDNPAEIRPSQLNIISAFFDCSIDELINEPKTPHKIISQFKKLKNEILQRVNTGSFN